MTQAALAQRMGRPAKTINEIIKGKAAITPETAIQLERTLGISSDFWMGIENQYRQDLARLESEERLAERADWLTDFPVADLVKHRLIKRGRTEAETLDGLLRWLGVGSPEAFDGLAAAASFRASPSFEGSPEATAAWLRWGELQAMDTITETYGPERFRNALERIRPLTRKQPFSRALARAKDACAEAGVVLLITPELSGTHLSGAARWISGRPLIQLTLRHKTDDQFWFSLFHEAGHVLEGRVGAEYVDSHLLADESAEEQIADQFARDALVPRSAYGRFVAAGDFSRDAVREFAQTHAIAAGVVVGRLEFDRLVGRGQLRDLKQPILFSSDS